MPLNTVDYQQVSRSPLPTGGIAAAALSVLIVLSVNGWLAWMADKGFGSIIWIFAFIPLANALLAAFMWQCTPIVRRISDQAGLYFARAALATCAVAVVADWFVIDLFRKAAS